MKPENNLEFTFMDTLRFYRDVFVGLWRFCARFPGAGLRTKILVVVAVVLCAGVVVGLIALRDKKRLAKVVPVLARGRQGGPQEPLAPVPADPELTRSIAAGVKNRMAYVDGYHSAMPSSLLFLKDQGITGFVFREDFVTNKRELMNSGLLIMGYQLKKPPLTDEEYEMVRKYVANGGRLLLMCPGWVWHQYEKKPMEELLYNKIGRDFGFFLTRDSAQKPYKIVHRWFAAPGFEDVLKRGTFSDIQYESGFPVMVSGNGRTAALAVQRGKSRAFIWAQNNLMNPKIAESPAGSAFIGRVLEWLMDDGIDLADDAAPVPEVVAKAGADGAPVSPELADAAIAASIAAGVKKRVVYVNTHHGAKPADLGVFKDAGAKAQEYGFQGLLYNQDALYGSGLLVMVYEMKKRTPEESEYAVIKRFIHNGGRVLLACPAWVWKTYEHKPVAELPYDIIAREFGLVMDTAYVKAPLRAVHPTWKFGGFEKKIGGTFSAIGHDPGNATPILVGSAGRTAAVTATRGKARIVLWAQDNLLNKDTLSNPNGRKVIVQMVNWLLE